MNGNTWVHDVRDVPDVPMVWVLICHDGMMVSEKLSRSEMVPRKEETKLKTTEAKELKEEQEAKQEKAAQKTSGTQEAEGKQVGCPSVVISNIHDDEKFFRNAHVILKGIGLLIIDD